MMAYRQGRDGRRVFHGSKTCLLELTSKVQHCMGESVNLCLGEFDSKPTAALELNWRAALEANTRIRTVDIWIQAEETETAPIIYSLVHSLGDAPRLTTLHIRGYCSAMPLSVVSSLLKRSPTLESFQLTSVKLQVTSDEDISDLSAAFTQTTALQEIKWHDVQLATPINDFDSGSAFLEGLFLGLSQASHLSSVLLHSTNAHALGRLCGSALQLLLQHSNTLRTFVLSDMSGFGDLYKDDAEDAFYVLAKLLALDQTRLKKLQIPFSITEGHCKAVESILQHNRSLEELTLLCFHGAIPSAGGMTSEANLALLSDALKRTQLKKFTMVGPAARITNPVVLHDFAVAPEINYGLHQVTLLCLINSTKHSTQVEYQCHLNQRGRGAWLHRQYNNDDDKFGGKGSGHCPIQFLSKVSSDLDALYYYLSTVNPSLLRHASEAF